MKTIVEISDDARRGGEVRRRQRRTTAEESTWVRDGGGRILQVDDGDLCSFRISTG